MFKIRNMGFNFMEHSLLAWSKVYLQKRVLLSFFRACALKDKIHEE